MDNHQVKEAQDNLAYLLECSRWRFLFFDESSDRAQLGPPAPFREASARIPQYLAQLHRRVVVADVCDDSLLYRIFRAVTVSRHHPSLVLILGPAQDLRPLFAPPYLITRYTPGEEWHELSRPPPPFARWKTQLRTRAGRLFLWSTDASWWSDTEALRLYVKDTPTALHQYFWYRETSHSAVPLALQRACFVDVCFEELKRFLA